MEKSRNFFLIIGGVILIVITFMFRYLREDGGSLTMLLWGFSFAMIIFGMLNPHNSGLLKRLIITVIFAIITTIVFFFILWGITSGWRL